MKMTKPDFIRVTWINWIKFRTQTGNRTSHGTSLGNEGYYLTIKIEELKENGQYFQKRETFNLKINKSFDAHLYNGRRILISLIHIDSIGNPRSIGHTHLNKVFDGKLMVSESLMMS